MNDELDIETETGAETSADMPTVPIPARHTATTFDTASKRERIEVKPPLVQLFRRVAFAACSPFPRRTPK